MRVCSVEGCNKPHSGLGYCENHRRMFKKHGDPLVKGVSSTQFQKGHGRKDRKPCSIEGCDRPVRANGWCQTHYMRWFHNGDPLAEPKRPRGPAAERFEFWVDKNGPVPKLRPDLGPCWTWRGVYDKRGYGRFADDTGWYDMAHRWSYKKFVGKIPEGLVIDHLCHNPHCVNPRHLEPTTHHDNILIRGTTNAAFVNKNKTHCNHGHPFTPENTYVYETKYGLMRVCKVCQKRRKAEYEARKARKAA